MGWDCNCLSIIRFSISDVNAVIVPLDGTKGGSKPSWEGEVALSEEGRAEAPCIDRISADSIRETTFKKDEEQVNGGLDSSPSRSAIVARKANLSMIGLTVFMETSDVCTESLVAGRSTGMILDMAIERLIYSWCKNSVC